MNMPIAGIRPVEILLVEDNQDDVLLARRGFQRAQWPVNLHHVENGEECMAFLRRRGPYANAPAPDLILLDLNMPVMDGREVMAELAADEELRQMPVVVLTTSADERDVLDMYRARCSSYVVKPVDFDEFLAAIHSIGQYWFKIAVLPSRA
ncbi:MAG TPA: response regulator [Rhodocyclaceae bacterium]|nr:response regulator [Rhodocyclaceae bacterium]